MSFTPGAVSQAAGSNGTGNRLETCAPLYYGQVSVGSGQRTLSGTQIGRRRGESEPRLHAPGISIDYRYATVGRRCDINPITARRRGERVLALACPD